MCRLISYLDLVRISFCVWDWNLHNLIPKNDHQRIDDPISNHRQSITKESNPSPTKKESNDNVNENMQTSPVPIHVLEYNWDEFMCNFKYIEHYTSHTIIFGPDIAFKMYFKSFHIQRLSSETISKCTSNLTGSNKESSFISKKFIIDDFRFTII